MSRTDSIWMDLVICNWCEWRGYVVREADDCPNCHNVGLLMDIKQDVEVGAG